MKSNIMVVMLVAFASLARAGTPGGHRADVGLLVLGEWPDRGGVVVEGRWNLAPEDPDAALYVTGALGFYNWIASTRPPQSFGWIPNLDKKRDSYTEWKAKVTPNFDLGLGASFKGYTGGFGLAVTAFDLDAKKVINKDEYTGGSASGTKVGVYIQGGYEVPIGHWALCLMVGYRQSRGAADVTMKNAKSVETAASLKPVDGPYAVMGMRYRFQ